MPENTFVFRGKFAQTPKPSASWPFPIQRTTPAINWGNITSFPSDVNENAFSVSTVRPTTPAELIDQYLLIEDWHRLMAMISKYFGQGVMVLPSVSVTRDSGEDQLLIEVRYAMDVPRKAYYDLLEEYVTALSIAAQERFTFIAFPVQ
ncbi:MAG: hypothetical protein HOP28_16355 [Gemmatimonadales bacterium]|nr:hypothetical protein [Gemmatimonadales bacterium]